MLDECGFGKVNIRLADGTQGWQEMAPFDAILVTAGAPEVPQHYLDQLAVGGRLIIPVGDQGEPIAFTCHAYRRKRISGRKDAGVSFCPLDRQLWLAGEKLTDAFNS